MFKTINTQELLRRQECVREPIDSLCSKIDKMDTNKIILIGGRELAKV